MRSMREWRLAGAVLIGTIAAASADARDLAVPANKGWQHAQTGIILMPTLAGSSRTALSDATDGEFDVTAQYEAADKSVITTLFLFHPAAGDVALWFDRARAALEANKVIRDMAPTSATPVAFAAPGAGATSALKQVYASAGGQFRSTALAVVPVGDWLIALRMTAPALSAAQLDERMGQVIAGVRWPRAGTSAARTAVPVAACAAPLAYAKAKMVKPDLGDVLIGLSLVSQAAAKTAKPSTPVTWCRDGGSEQGYSVYRADQGTDGYTMALGDAGRVVSVAPSLMGQVNKTGTYSVTLRDVDGSASTLPSFNKMPAPAQVWSAVSSGKVAGRVQGKEVTLDASGS
ncbi:hypothetical protein [Sphingomonas citricola]|uniref:hypothetical protein n=1 Tax=Sphingomonas citricola TaxID=2862498 RepID=UPI0021565C23|nr:hypothetical protein [Sphingomonas citricola]